MEVVCIRPSWVLFPASVRRVLDHLRDAAPSASPSTPGRHREPLPILRSYVDPADAARAFRLALELSTTPYRVFIITAADTFEPEPTLPHLEKVYGKPLPRVVKPEVYAEILTPAPSTFPGRARFSAGARHPIGRNSPRASTLPNPPDSSPFRASRPETAVAGAGKMPPSISGYPAFMNAGPGGHRAEHDARRGMGRARPLRAHGLGDGGPDQAAHRRALGRGPRQAGGGVAQGAQHRADPPRPEQLVRGAGRPRACERRPRR